jgi:hypothetical protein
MAFLIIPAIFLALSFYSAEWVACMRMLRWAIQVAGG